MFIGKIGYRIVLACIVLFFCLSAVSKVFAEEIIIPESTADYGSGSTNMDLYYDGGVTGAGIFLGQPNTLTRNDRALVRFMISPYVLSASPVASAKLCFGVAYFCALDDAHQIEITHLSYDANRSFSANDMVNSRAEIVELVPVKKDAPADKEYSIDVTKYVNADIAKGNIYSAFRFKDVTAETKSRGNATTAYGVSLKNLFQLKLR